MSKSETIPQYDDNHYAVVDLGSNSFHLLISRLVDNNVEIVNKVKRKVRLAAGLDCQNELNQDAIERGLDCLTLFAKHLASIPQKNIRIVATAALRIAKNNNHFIRSANKILPAPIKLLSGEQEANTIYSGVAYTSHNSLVQKRLVLDIGGASTELIVGEGVKAIQAISLNLGCVSFKERYFCDNKLTEDNFEQAIAAAIKIIAPNANSFIKLGWQLALGSSGTMRALAEILAFRQHEIIITADFLQEIKHALIDCKTIDAITANKPVFEGLREDRAPVLASGLSILIALFTCLQIKELTLSTGALREGLLFEMLDNTLPNK
ncbi:MAG: phosphatase [Colwellia sp.]|nr:phosphatase [Colwellia sp.]MCW8864577.1 phosphatase [Colwellia sp.]MCW9080644.1 phosphatase [Colwellia sp.]